MMAFRRLIWYVGSGTYLATRTVLSLLERTSAGTQTSLASGRYILLVAAMVCCVMLALLLLSGVVLRWRCAAVLLLALRYAVARASRCAARRAAPQLGVTSPLRFRR